MPRFVADAARAAGFRGILYCSTRFDGYNAVLFDWSRAEIRPLGQPAIVEYQAGRPLPPEAAAESPPRSTVAAARARQGVLPGPAVARPPGSATGGRGAPAPYR
jgi:hypothetical protein